MNGLADPHCYFFYPISCSFGKDNVCQVREKNRVTLVKDYGFLAGRVTDRP